MNINSTPGTGPAKVPCGAGVLVGGRVLVGRMSIDEPSPLISVKIGRRVLVNAGRSVGVGDIATGVRVRNGATVIKRTDRSDVGEGIGVVGGARVGRASCPETTKTDFAGIVGTAVPSNVAGAQAIAPRMNIMGMTTLTIVFT